MEKEKEKEKKVEFMFIRFFEENFPTLNYDATSCFLFYIER
jgi:hypothetical protein